MHLTIVEPDPMDRDDDGRSLSDQGSHSVDQISSNQQEMENTSLFVSFNTNFKLTSLKIKQLKVGVFFCLVSHPVSSTHIGSPTLGGV